MALTNIITCDKVYRALAAMGLSPVLANIESTIPQGLQQLGEQEAGGINYNRLTKTATVTMTSGAASLSSLTDRVGDLIRRIWHADGTPISLLPRGSTRTDLTYERSQLYDWAVIEGGSIYVMNGDGVTVPSNESLSVLYSYIPAIGDVPDDLADDFIGILISMNAAAIKAAA